MGFFKKVFNSVVKPVVSVTSSISKTVANAIVPGLGNIGSGISNALIGGSSSGSAAVASVVQPIVTSFSDNGSLTLPSSTNPSGLTGIFGDIAALITGVKDTVNKVGSTVDRIGDVGDTLGGNKAFQFSFADLPKWILPLCGGLLALLLIKPLISGSPRRR